MIDYIGKISAAVIGTAGLMVSTEQVVLQINYTFIIGAIISSILSAYGLYHIVKDIKEYFKNR